MANTTLTVTSQGGTIIGGLTAKSTSGVGLAGSTSFLGSGKYYFECTWNVFGSTGIGVGIGDHNLLTTGAQNGAPDIALLFPNQLSSGVYCNATNASVNLGANSVVNDVCCVAVDLTAGLIWFRRNAGSWNGSGTANPASGVGGVNYLQYWPTGGIVSYGFAPYAFMYGTNDQMTLNFGDSAYAQAVPSGFGNWIVPTGMTNRVSNLNVTVASSGAPKNRASAFYNEVVAALQPGAVPSNRISALYDEAVTSGPPADNRVSNVYVELVAEINPNFGVPPQARAMVMA